MHDKLSIFIFMTIWKVNNKNKIHYTTNLKNITDEFNLEREKLVLELGATHTSEDIYLLLYLGMVDLGTLHQFLHNCSYVSVNKECENGNTGCLQTIEKCCSVSDVQMKMDYFNSSCLIRKTDLKMWRKFLQFLCIILVY